MITIVLLINKLVKVEILQVKRSQTFITYSDFLKHLTYRRLLLNKGTNGVKYARQHDHFRNEQDSSVIQSDFE